MNTTNLSTIEESKGTEVNKITGAEVKTQTHVSFREYSSDNWREYFRKEDTLLKVLEATSLTNTHVFAQVNSRYLIDDHRIAIILLLKRKGTEILDKVIVDVISGSPTFAQLMDVFYNIGSDCDYRIVLYDENTKREEKRQGDEVYGHMMCSLMDELRGQVSLSVMGIDLEMNDENVISLKCVNLESISKNGKDSKLPSRSILEGAQFWGPYFYPAHSDVFRCKEYNLFSDVYEEDGSGYVLSSVADWNDDGMVVDYTFENDDLIWLLSNKREDIERMFEGCSINISSEEHIINRKKNISIHDIVNAISKAKEDLTSTSTEYTLTITRSIPFRNFMYSLPDDRDALTNEFVGYARAALYIDELLDEREDETSQTTAS